MTPRHPTAALSNFSRDLRLLGWSSAADTLACYQEVDIALDTFPFNGCLTTYDALWMGVPVITHRGDTFASRQGLSLLSTIGLTETIATTTDEYVEAAVRLASDIPRLNDLRGRLRRQMEASPLCDGARFAADFSALIRQTWREWLAQNDRSV